LWGKYYTVKVFIVECNLSVQPKTTDVQTGVSVNSFPCFGVNNHPSCLSQHFRYTLYNYSKHGIVLKLNESAAAAVSLSITVLQERTMPQINFTFKSHSDIEHEQAAFSVS
jgi:hypothetical protein